MAADLLGQMLVSVIGDNSQLDETIDQSKSKADELSEKFEKVGKTATKFLTLPILGAAGAAVKFASSAEEGRSKFETAFKGVVAQADKTRDNLVNNYGLAQSSAEKLLGGTADLVKGFGASAEEALVVSNSVQELAVDLASYNNFAGGAAGASEILTKAFLGERDSLISLGIKVSEEAVKAKLVEKGQQDLTGQALLLAKGYATLELATGQSVDAQGDFARTQTQTANRARVAQERIKDLAVTMGRDLLPIAADILGGANDLISGFNEMGESTRKVVFAMGGVAAGVGPAIVGIKKLSVAITFLAAHPAVLAVAAITALAGVIALAASNAQDFKNKELAKDFQAVADAASITVEKAKEISVFFESFVNLGYGDVEEAITRVAEAYEVTKEEAVEIVAASRDLTLEQKIQLGQIQQQIDTERRKKEAKEETLIALENERAITSGIMTLESERKKINKLIADGILSEIEGIEEKKKLREKIINDLKKEALRTGELSDQQQNSLRRQIALVEVYDKRLDSLRTSEEEALIEAEENEVSFSEGRIKRDEDLKEKAIANREEESSRTIKIFDEIQKKKDSQRKAELEAERKLQSEIRGAIQKTFEMSSKFANLSLAFTEARIQKDLEAARKKFEAETEAEMELAAFLKKEDQRQFDESIAAKEEEVQRLIDLEEWDARRELELEIERDKSERQLRADARNSRETANEELAKEERRLARDAAIAQRENAKFNIAVNALSAGMRVYSDLPLYAAIPASILIAGLAIGQAAAVDAVPLPELNTGAIIPGSSKGVAAIMGENHFDEVVISNAPKGRAILNEFADTINGRREEGGRDLSFSFYQNNMLSLASRVEMEEAARSFAPYLVRELRRTGVKI